MRRTTAVTMLALAATTLAASPAARAQSAPSSPPPPPCASAEYRQFDFWIGDWDVTTPDGKPAGTNNVTRPLGTCVLQEHWKGKGGMSGESYNIYDRVTKRWHQTWVDDRGTLLLLDGGLEEGAMVLRGAERTIAGKPTTDRITWQPRSADEVHQIWDQSNDQGKTWSTVFHGVYRRKKS